MFFFYLLEMQYIINRIYCFCFGLFKKNLFSTNLCAAPLGGFSQAAAHLQSDLIFTRNSNKNLMERNIERFRHVYACGYRLSCFSTQL